MSERFVVLGLAHVRSVWFAAVAQWAHSATIPVEFVKCLSAEEVRARLAARRPYSALITDASLPEVDRDLLGAARAAGTAVVVVEDPRVPRDWAALGASALLPAGFERADLLAVLTQHARGVPRNEPTAPLPDPGPREWRGAVACVTGAGGTGASTVAIALAQSLADDVRNTGLVLLADLCLNAEQGMLHHARDVVPGVQELAEAHRAGTPSIDDVRALAFDVEERGYHLLLGLRRARFWTAIRPRAFEAAFDSLRRAFRIVVCDIDGDVEGEGAGGSIDVEERNHLPRTAALESDIVFVVGTPSMKGIHSLVRVAGELAALGVDAPRIVPVINQAPRAPRAKVTLSQTVGRLLAPAIGPRQTADAVFLPVRKVDEAFRDGVRLPAGLGPPLVAAFEAAMASSAPASRPQARPVEPGSLGTWSDQAVGG
jgi:hypothetical protein